MSSYGRSSRKPLTCYNCQKQGHHIRDCPEPSKKKRYGGGKRGRDEEKSEAETIRWRLKKLLVQISDKHSVVGQVGLLEKSLSSLARMLEKDIAEHTDYILETLFLCIKSLPVATPVYATLVALVNSANPSFGSAVVQRLASSLRESLKERSFLHARLLVRMVVCLANAHVITPADVFTLLNTLVDFAEEKSSRSLGGLQLFLLYATAAALPWGGECLARAGGGEQLGALVAKLGRAVAAALGKGEAYAALLRVLPPSSSDSSEAAAAAGGSVGTEDRLRTVWKLVDGAWDGERGEWKAEAEALLEPHKHFEERLKKTSSVHAFALGVVPTGNAGDSSAPFNLVSALRLFQNAEDLGECEGAVDFLGDGSVDRWLMGEYASDTLISFDAVPKEGIKQLLNLPLDRSKHSPSATFPIILESVFSHMLALPRPSVNVAYFGSVVVALFKANHAYFSPLLARAIDKIFLQLDQMDVQCRDRFSQWFAMHLSNFGFKWFWQDWLRKFPHLLDDSPAARLGARSIFLREALLRCVRLSFFERIKATIPATEEHKALSPVKPDPTFLEAKGQESAVSAKLVEQFRAAEENVLESVKGKCVDSNRSSFVFACSILQAGHKTFSHLFALLNRYRQAILELNSTPEAQMGFIQAVAFVWQNSSLHVEVILQQLFVSKAVSVKAICDWIFSQRDLFHTCSLWHILFSTITQTLRSLDKESEAETKEKLLASLLSQFDLALAAEKPQDPSNPIYMLLRERLRQFLRTFHHSIKPCLPSLRKQAFVAAPAASKQGPSLLFAEQLFEAMQAWDASSPVNQPTSM